MRHPIHRLWPALLIAVAGLLASTWASTRVAGQDDAAAVAVPGTVTVPPYGQATFVLGPPAGEAGPNFALEVDSETPEPVTASYTPSATYDAQASEIDGELTLSAPNGAVVELQSGCQTDANWQPIETCAAPLGGVNVTGGVTIPNHRVWFGTRPAGYTPPPGACPLPIPPFSGAPPPGPLIPGQPGTRVCDARGLGVSGIGGPIGSACFLHMPLSPGMVTAPPPTPSRVAVPGSVCLRDDSASVTFYDPRSDPATPAEVTVTAEGGGAGTTITFDDLGLAIASSGGPVIVTTEPDPCEPSGDQFTTVVCPGVTLDPPSSVEFTVDTAHPQPEHILTVPTGWSLMGFPDGTILPRNWTAFTLDPAASDAGYIELPPRSVAKGGAGYWVDVLFDFPQRELVPSGAVTPQTVALPPGQWALIGNPFNGMAALRGADAVEMYDPVTDNYRPVTALYPGEGAWAYSADGGMLIVTPAGD